MESKDINNSSKDNNGKITINTKSDLNVEPANNSTKFYRKSWFTITSIVVVSVLVIGVILYFIIPSGKISKTYDTYFSKLSYTVPSTKAVPGKEAVYQKLDDIKLFAGDPYLDKNNDGKPDFKEVYAGKDFPAGVYKISELELYEYCSLQVRAADDGMFDGDRYYKDDILYIKEGERLGAFNCRSHIGGLNVTLTPFEKGELISKSIATKNSIPEHKVKEKVIFGDYRADTCYIDTIESPCSTLKLYSELKAQKPSIYSTTTEELNVFIGKTCYTNDRKTDCNDLSTIDYLLENIVLK